MNDAIVQSLKMLPSISNKANKLNKKIVAEYKHYEVVILLFKPSSAVYWSINH